MNKENQEGSPRLSSALNLAAFGISFSEKPPGFNRWQEEDFIGCCSYMREALYLLSQKDALRLIRFVSLYAGIDWQKGGVPQPLWLKKQNFAKISIEALRETVGRHRSPRQIASSPDFQSRYPAASRHYLDNIFYYWVAVMHQVMPQLNFPAEEALKQKVAFRLGERKAGLALSRAATVLSLAHTIAEKRALLTQLGISPIQQNLWMGALMGMSPRNYRATDQDAQEELWFRHHAVSGPHVSLAGEKTRVVIGRLPEGSRQKRIGMIIRRLIDYFEVVEADKRVETMREPRIATLRWLRQRTGEEIADIIGELASRPYKGRFSIIFSGKKYRSSKQCARQGRREYSPRIDPGKMAASTLAMIIEYLEGKRPPEILYHQHLPELAQKEALTLLGEAENNLTTWPALFNNSVRRQIAQVRTKLIRLKNGELTDKEILNLLYVASKKRFSAEKFLTDFRQVFNFDLLWLDEPEIRERVVK